MTSTSPAPARNWRDWLGLLARLVVGGVILYSGIQKATSFAYSVQAVRNFAILPDALAPLVGYALPVIEIVIGLLLIVGLFTRVAGAIEAVLMLAFIAGIISLWARGLKIDCGCFGGGGIDEGVTWRDYLWHILGNTGLFLGGLWLAIRPRTPFAVDNWLFRDITVPDDDLTDETPED